MTTNLTRTQALVVVALIGITTSGTFLRLWALDRESAYSDEVASLQHLSAPDLGEFLRRVRVSDPPMTPGYFIVEYAWARLTGNSLYALRLLSVALGVASIPLVFLLGQGAYGALGGLTAAGLFAVSLPQVYYAQEMRPYALVLCLALVASLSMLRAVRGGRAWWAVNIAANVALMWTHLFTVLFLLAQGAFLVFVSLRRRRSRVFLWWTAAHAPSALLLLAWVESIDRANLEVAAAWRNEIVHSYLQPLGDFLLFSGAGVPLFRDVPAIGSLNAGSIMWRFFALVFALHIALGVWRWKMRAGGSDSETEGSSRETRCFLWTWLVVPPAALFLLSALLYACHSSRYVLYSSLPFFVLAGGTVTLVPRRALQGLLIAALLFMQGLAHHAYPRPWRPDIASAAAFLAEQDVSPATPVVVHIMADVPSMRFNGPPRMEELALTGENAIEGVPAHFDIAESGETRWLVLFQHQLGDAVIARTERAIGERGWSIEKNSFGYASPIHVYRLRRDRATPAAGD
ncbi:MAG TPA: glycosyltransferase family 39 protein [Candidatus Hydrogenedentes bacterium]|nr:glycosyltransferase family 39 protein [Candidatus Hydrogenedentota bacterium]